MSTCKERVREITGRLITLRLLDPMYFSEYHRMFSPVVRTILQLPEQATEQETIDFLSAQMTFMDDPKRMFYCIFDNQTQKLIGAIEFRDKLAENGQLGAWLNEKFWGGGRYQEALALMLDYYCSWAGETIVNAIVKALNTRSLKAHQKAGFKIIDEFIKEEGTCCVGQQVYRLLWEK
jgi:RimJ/RimL family protein N-acetyltransferase